MNLSPSLSHLQTRPHSALSLLRSLIHPRKINQPPPRFGTLPASLTYPSIRLPLQTPPRDIAVRAYILDQTLFADVVVLGPDEAEDQEVERGAVEGGWEGRGEDVDLDAAGLVGVEGVVADA